MDLSLNLESKKYRRISWSFKEKKPLKFDFLLAWHQTGMKCELCNDTVILRSVGYNGGPSGGILLWSGDTADIGVWAL